MIKSQQSHPLSANFNHKDFYRHLGEELNLCSNGAMVFHWADFKETCDQIKDRLENDPELKKDFEFKKKHLDRLNMIPVWIRTQAKVYQTTMYALYETHILNRTQQMDGLDFFGPLQISLISGTGPFKSMAVSEFFNKDLYQDFVLLNLIKGLLPKRDFRIRLKTRILMEYGSNFEKAQLISLEQLTTRGLLLSMNTDLYLKEVSGSAQVRFLIETNTLGDALGKEMDELKVHLSQFEFNLMYSSKKSDAMDVDLSEVQASSSFEFLKDHKKYLFVSYQSLKSQDQEAVKRIETFVDYSKALVRSYFSQDKNAA